MQVDEKWLVQKLDGMEDARLGLQPDCCQKDTFPIPPERWLMRGLVFAASFSVMSPPVWFYAAGVLFGFDRVTPWAALAPYKPEALLFLVGMFGGCLLVNWLCRVEPKEKLATRLVVDAWAGKKAELHGRLRRTFKRTKWFRYYLASFLFPVAAFLFFYCSFRDDGAWIDGSYLFVYIWPTLGAVMSASLHQDEVSSTPTAPEAKPFGAGYLGADRDTYKAGL